VRRYCPTFPICNDLIGRILHVFAYVRIEILLPPGSDIVTATWRAEIRLTARRSRHYSDTSPVLAPVLRPVDLLRLSPPSAGRHRQRPDPPKDRSEHPARQVTLRQHQPVVTGMFHRRPPVLTRRCWRLVSDQLSMRGSTSRRHRFPKFVRDYANQSPGGAGPKSGGGGGGFLLLSGEI
jgi:hypothetical protein